MSRDTFTDVSFSDISASFSFQLFARRCLDKVHELAQLEQQAATPKTDASIASFTEITIKVCPSYSYMQSKVKKSYSQVSCDHVIAASDHVTTVSDESYAPL